MTRGRRRRLIHGWFVIGLGVVTLALGVYGFVAIKATWLGLGFSVVLAVAVIALGVWAVRHSDEPY